MHFILTVISVERESRLQQHGHLFAGLARILDFRLFGENSAVWATGRGGVAGHLFCLV